MKGSYRISPEAEEDCTVSGCMVSTNGALMRLTAISWRSSSDLRMRTSLPTRCNILPLMTFAKAIAGACVAEIASTTGLLAITVEIMAIIGRQDVDSYLLSCQ